MINSKITWERSSLFLLGFVLVNIYVPGTIGASIPTGWFFLLLTIPVFIYFYDIKIKLAHIYGFMLLVYAGLSLLWTTNLNIGYFIFLQFTILCCVFCLGSALKDIRPILIGLAVGLIVSDVIAFVQYFDGHSVVFTIQGNVAGLFVNKNVFCEVSAALFICLLVFKLWYFIPATLPGIVLVHSRGAILGLFVGCLVWLYKQNRNACYIVSVTIAISGLIYYWENSNTISIMERFNLWADTINGFKFFGNGIGSFEILYPHYATHIDTSLARPRFAHNDLLHYIFEFGMGASFLIMVLLNVFRINSDSRTILYTIGTISMFAYPLHIPVTAFIGFLVAGYITRSDNTFEHFRYNGRSDLSKRIKGKRVSLLSTKQANVSV